MIIEARDDAITCVACRVAVPEGKVCGCPARTYGPRIEAPTTRIHRGEGTWTETPKQTAPPLLRRRA